MMSSTDLLVHKFFLLVINIFAVMNYVYIALRMFETFEFFRTPTFNFIKSLMFTVLSPIYRLVDKIVFRTIFDDKLFNGRFRDITIPFVTLILAYQITFFIKSRL